jgi:hypothetical protein
MKPKCIEIFKKGQSQGKLLLSLCLLKTINKNNQNVSEKFESICRIRNQKFNLKLSCLGLRNLPKDIYDPIIIFSIKSQKFKQVFKINDEEENKASDRVNSN